MTATSCRSIIFRKLTSPWFSKISFHGYQTIISNSGRDYWCRTKEKMFDDLALPFWTDFGASKRWTARNSGVADPLNERCTQKEFRKFSPAKIACFAEFMMRFHTRKMKRKTLWQHLMHPVTVIEFVATKFHPAQNGRTMTTSMNCSPWCINLQTLVHWGRAITFGFADPEMGLLPQADHRIDKSFEQDVLTPFFEAKQKAQCWICRAFWK